MAIFLLGPDPAGNCCDCTSRANVCDSCGAALDLCALILPPIGGGTPYASYALAEAAINDQTSNCIGYVGTTPFISFTASQGTNTFTLNCSANAILSGGTYGRGHALYGSLNLLAPATLSVLFTLTGGTGTKTVTLDVYNSSNALVSSETITYSSPTTLTFSVSTSGRYTVVASSSTTGSASAFVSTLDAAFSSTSTLITNPIVAIWDDGGTDRQLEACPKMYLPPLTESSGSWYASQSAAQTDINNNAFNCVVYRVSSGGTFAGSGGTSISVSDDVTPSTGATLAAYASLNGVAGATLHMSFSGGPRGRLAVYDYNGASLFNQNSLTSPIISSALPYTGRYIIFIELYQEPTDPIGPSTCSATVTSSGGTMSTNQIQALYDVSLTCAARLNC